MSLAFFANLAWLLALVGIFVASQLWGLRQIERETPPRGDAADRR